MMRLVSQQLTKIINIPNMKDHGATGATGCLKNIAYGSFSNVARTHQRGKSHTFSFVGTLAAGRAAAIADRAADHGRPARRLARRAVRAHEALRLLPEEDLLRHRSGGDRSAAARHHRRRAQGRGRDLDLGSLAVVAAGSTTPRRATATRTSTSSSASPATWSSPPALGLGVADLARIRVQDIRGMTCCCWSGRAAAALLAGGLRPRRRSRGRHRARLRAARAGGVVARGRRHRDADDRAGARRARVAAAPGIVPRPGVASPTRSPWVNANGWRFMRPGDGKFVYDVPAGKARAGRRRSLRLRRRRRLEVDAGRPRARSGRMFAFFASICRPLACPTSPTSPSWTTDRQRSGEVMNLLSRRNLLFPPVPRRRVQFPMNVQARDGRLPARRRRGPERVRARSPPPADR